MSNKHHKTHEHKEETPLTPPLENQEALIPKNDELQETKPEGVTEGLTGPLPEEIKHELLIMFNTEDSIKNLEECYKNDEHGSVLVLGAQVAIPLVLEVLKERELINSPSVRDEAIAYFRKEQTLLGVILTNPHNFTQLKLDHLNNGDGVHLSNANLIGWFEEDEVLGPIVQEIAGNILADAEHMAALKGEEPPVAVEEPINLDTQEVVVEPQPANNTLKCGI